MKSGPRHLLRAVAAAAVGATLVGSVAAPADAGTSAVAFHDADGIRVVAATHDGARLWKLTVASADLSRPVQVDVLLPTGYGDTARRYPTLYLFHGTSGRADDWVTQGGVVAATASAPMIVVMPDAGYDGNGGSWFTDWVDQHTSLGTADWEDFHVDQVIPWIDANLRTVSARSGRAIAGLSQGGFGSFSYAARHPDLFASAASFSGAPDIASNPVVLAGATAVIGGTASGLDGVQPFAMFGDPVTDNVNWQGHNPASLVTNLGSTALRLWTGNGAPGPLDTNPLGAVGGTPIEAVVHESALSFAQAASAAHVPYRLVDYGPGTHTWPYWARDLRAYLPDLERTFARPAAAPAAITYRSVDRTWRQWGWTVVNHRAAAQEFSGLTAASAHGFTFSGTSATVTTPAVHRPGTRYTVSGSGGSTPSVVRADPRGRLTIHVTTGRTGPTVSIGSTGSIGSTTVTITATPAAAG